MTCAFGVTHYGGSPWRTNVRNGATPRPCAGFSNIQRSTPAPSRPPTQPFPRARIDPLNVINHLCRIEYPGLCATKLDSIINPLGEPDLPSLRPPASPRTLLRFYADLAGRSRAQLGWIPPVVIERRMRRGELIFVAENGVPAGFLLTHLRRDGIARIHQAAIDYNARRRQLGTRLVRAFERDATASGAHHVALYCRDDLEANAFWASIGYNRRGSRRGGFQGGSSLQHFYVRNLPGRPPLTAV